MLFPSAFQTKELWLELVGNSGISLPTVHQYRYESSHQIDIDLLYDLNCVLFTSKRWTTKFTSSDLQIGYHPLFRQKIFRRNYISVEFLIRNSVKIPSEKIPWNTAEFFRRNKIPLDSVRNSAERNSVEKL